MGLSTTADGSLLQILGNLLEKSQLVLVTTAFIFVLCGIFLFIFQPAINLYVGDNDIGVQEGKLIPGKQDEKIQQPVILSLIIPAYNEEDRLPEMLDSTFECLQNENLDQIKSMCHDALLDPKGHSNGQHHHSNNKFNENNHHQIEIVIVNDGSKDNTVDVVRNYIQNKSESHQLNDCVSVRLLSLTRNGGKGAAVRAGMIRSRGQLCLMVDADGATEFDDGIRKALTQMKRMKDNRIMSQQSNSSSSSFNNECIIFGSRAHLEEESKASRSPIRTLLMHSFHFFVETLCSSRIKDTQCGFKLFTRNAAIQLFTNLHLRRWAFDIELVVIAEHFEIPMAEIAVKWHEVDGSKLATSKLSLVWNSIGMLRDMICVRLCYALRIWKFQK